MLTFRGFVGFMLLVAFGIHTGGAAKKSFPGSRTYVLEVEAFEVIRDPSFLVQINRLRVGKYNSTTNMINGNFNYTGDIPAKTMISIKAFQLMASNKYSMIPVGPAPFLICDVVELDKQYYPTIRAHGNLPAKCPIKKGQYWIKNFVPRFKDLPDQLPGERWRVDVDVTAGKTIVAKFKIFVYLNRNI